MTPPDSLNPNYRFISPLDEFKSRIISMHQYVRSWWVENSTLIITSAILIAVAFICLMTLVTILADRELDSGIDEWQRTEQYWQDKRNSKLLPRGYFSTMRQVTMTDDEGDESE